MQKIKQNGYANEKFYLFHNIFYCIEKNPENSKCINITLKNKNK